MAGKQPLTTILSVPPRRAGQLSIKIEINDVKAISYHGVCANLPDNIQKKCASNLFADIAKIAPYKLKSTLAAQFKPDANFPQSLIIEEIRPAFCDLLVSAEADCAGVRWLGAADTQAALATCFEQFFVTESYLSNLNVANVKLRVSVDPDEVDAVEREYKSGQGFAEQPTLADLQLWTQIEIYHADNIRQHLHWARETESWLEHSLGSFLMTCKQVLPNGEPLTDAGKLERKASMSSRASVDKMGMTSFANAFRHIVAISAELADQIIDKLQHTHRFDRKHPTLFEIRNKTIELIRALRDKYSVIMEVEIRTPQYEIYDPWRSKVLAKEVELYLPLVSIIPHFKEHLLDVDVHMDELKAHLTSSFPNECRVLTEVSQAASNKPLVSTESGNKAPKPSKLT